MGSCHLKLGVEGTAAGPLRTCLSKSLRLDWRTQWNPENHCKDDDPVRSPRIRRVALAVSVRSRQNLQTCSSPVSASYIPFSIANGSVGLFPRSLIS